MTYGRHMTLDLEDCNTDKLKDLNFLSEFLEQLPTKINMLIISQPSVFRYKGKVPEDWGVTGFIIIAESHISIHTYPEKKYCFVDVFSCNDFDTNTTKQYIINNFEAKSSDVKSVIRGINFPR